MPEYNQKESFELSKKILDELLPMAGKILDKYMNEKSYNYEARLNALSSCCISFVLTALHQIPQEYLDQIIVGITYTLMGKLHSAIPTVMHEHVLNPLKEKLN